MSDTVANPRNQARSRGHGEFLRLWESSAPLSDEANQLCTRLETSVAFVVGRVPLSATTSGAAESDDIQEGHVASNGKGRTYKGADGLSGLAAVTTAEEFHAWHAEMERRLEEASDEKFRAMLAGLNADRDACDALLQTVNTASEALETIKQKRTDVAGTTERFRADCETLVAERERMAELADALRRRLTYFEELETLTAKFGTGTDAITPTHPDFVKLLHRLDECVAYASSSTGAVAEADGYVVRFLEVQRRAFSIVRDHTVSLIRTTATQVAKELKDERAQGAGFRHADLTDASKEYLRFRTIASRVKSLMTELHERAKAPAAKVLPYNNSGGAPSTTNGSSSGNGRYSVTSDVPTAGSGTLAGNPVFSTRNAAMTLYNDCEECFLEQRRRLLEPSVIAHIKSIAEVRNMIALARLGSSYVLRVCQLERQLYEHFFPVESDEDESPVLAAALNEVCDVLYTELRPQILQEQELDKLVYLIEVLKTEILGDEVPRRGAAGIAFAPSAVRAIADAQERIIFRAEVFLRDEVRGFIPAPIHLDYPELILSKNRTRASVLAAARSQSTGSAPLVPGDTTGSGPVGAEGTSPSEAISNPLAKASSTPNSAGVKTGVPSSSDSRSVGIYSTWYPPVERTLRLLSMLYRCVDGEVFAGLAQEAVGLCVQSVTNAATRIGSSGRPDAEDHAQLFLIWQLLMTREQISPFDVDMSYTEHELDFFELRSLLGSVIRGQLSVRSLATPPAVRQTVLNSRQELDHRVRTACETFILKVTRTLLEPVLSFLAKCNAMPSKAAYSPAPGEVPVTPPSATAFDQLKTNKGSFAHPGRLASMWTSVESSVSGDLPVIVERMKIYITKPASRAVLLRPVRANIAEAATELLSALQTRYSLDERKTTGIDGSRVTKLLNAVDVATDLAPRSNVRSHSTEAGNASPPVQ